MNEWMSEWVSEWRNKWMNERMNERTNERMNLYSALKCTWCLLNILKDINEKNKRNPDEQDNWKSPAESLWNQSVSHLAKSVVEVTRRRLTEAIMSYGLFSNCIHQPQFKLWVTLFAYQGVNITWTWCHNQSCESSLYCSRKELYTCSMYEDELSISWWIS